MAKKVVLVFLFVLFLFGSAHAVEYPSVEAYRIQIINIEMGRVEVSYNKGVTFEVLGFVVQPVLKLNDTGFTASYWAGSSEVAATAVNAIHVKVSDPRTIFSILPYEFIEPKKVSNSYFSSKSSLYTDIPAGKKIFGGVESPFVGNSVLLNGKPINAVPQKGDTIAIIVTRPQKWPKAIEFENKFAGKITIIYPDGEQVVVGEVLKPVQGVGRFEGSLYAPAGRIRANHPGVIDISTSTGGRLGGFQIIPAGHAQDKEMSYARVKTQWMVISENSVFDKTPEGMPPLFKYFLKPQYNQSDLYAADWDKKILNRFLVDVQYEDRPGWKPMPIYGVLPTEDLPDDANQFLKKVSKIRILFPVVK